MRVFKKRPLLFAASAISAAVAAPSAPTPFPFSQEDGSVVTIQQIGDEYYNFAQTIDGYLIVGDGNGSYVYADAEGMPSKYIAKNANERTEEEKAFLKTLNQNEVRSRHRALNGNRFPETKARPVKKSSVMYRPSKNAFSFVVGDRYFPALLVSTSDFPGDDSTFFSRMFNEEGYKDNDYYGSLRDYFISSSGGKFRPTFDIYPIKLPKKFGEYSSEDKLLAAALDILVEREDFKARAEKYEKVSPFIFLHPLSNDKAKTYNRQYFSHQYTMEYCAGRPYSKNGYTFDSYAFVAQKLEYTDDKVNMLGTFAHEFSHVLGLYDTYGTNAEGYAVLGPLSYDVMALGLRNGNGKFPPTFSAFERESMGWLTLDELSSPDSVYVVKNLSEMQAYSVTNPSNADEYFIIEYRPAVGFDSKIKGTSYVTGEYTATAVADNGVFVWYIDYDSWSFSSNDPNGDASHQRVDVRKVISQNRDYFADFSFNKGGKPSVPGVYNFILDGDKRACFTLSSAKELLACPAEADTVENENDSLSQNPLEMSSSSSSKKDSADAIMSPLVARSANMHVQLSSRILRVESSSVGEKLVKVFDALGNLVKVVSFAGSSVSVELNGIPSGILMVQLDLNGKVAGVKRVVLTDFAQ